MIYLLRQISTGLYARKGFFLADPWGPIEEAWTFETPGGCNGPMTRLKAVTPIEDMEGVPFHLIEAKPITFVRGLEQNAAYVDGILAGTDGQSLLYALGITSESWTELPEDPYDYCEVFPHRLPLAKAFA